MESQSLRHWIVARYIPQNLAIRDERTRQHYRRAVDNFAEHLGREPLLSDLSDETLTGLLAWLLNVRELAETTANERVGRLRAFWEWAARKRHVDQWPTLKLVDEPERIPIAWREDELVKLFNACRRQRGEICGIPAWRWWFCIHGFMWCSGERIGATLSMRLDHLRLSERIAVLPASIRKGKRKPAVHVLWEDLCLMLAQILPPNLPRRDIVFPWPRHQSTLYYHYGRLLDMAGLENTRYSKPHKMRVSHATWCYLAGDDPTKRLGHSDPSTTKRYIDSTLARDDDGPKLFRPW